MKFWKYTSSLFITLTAFSAIAATNTDEVVIMQNVTYCHITATGKHVIGYGTPIGTFDQDGRDFSIIYQSGFGKVPLIKKNGRQYVVLDYTMAADRFEFDYTEGDKYIVGYEDSGHCSQNNFPPCLKISKVNPCT